ncbi:MULTISPECIES: hypothetical protein [unclassified Prochlorococcus]|nr:hypothetical protein [Prochlorococcus sp. MIT 0602]
MTELLLPVKQDEKAKAEKGFANRDAMKRYLKLTNELNKKVKRKRAKKLIQQSQREAA